MLSVRCIYLTAAILISCSSLWCQVEAKSDRDSGRVSPCLVNLKLMDSSKRMAVEDSERHKNEVKQSEMDDWGVLRGARAKLRASFSDTFSDSDIRELDCLAWQEYRKENPNGKLDLDKFAAYAAANYGGLRVRSTPEGAAIIVDNSAWDGPTDAQNMCTVGTRHVVLSKPGYYDESGDIVVQQGQWANFERTLKPKP